MKTTSSIRVVPPERTDKAIEHLNAALARFGPLVAWRQAPDDPTVVVSLELGAGPVEARRSLWKELVTAALAEIGLESLVR